MDVDVGLRVIVALRGLADELGMAGGVERVDELLDGRLNHSTYLSTPLD